VHVDGEAAACDERPETGRHGCEEVARPELAVAADPPDLAVSEDVSDVGKHLGAEGGHEPDRIDRPQARGDVTETRDPGNGE
jgi:hypothetical protein